ncbi:MAG: class I SAM-dependent methyltransferase [Gemmatimonadetes bacterium]|nr:class I SAM-dependent methyltransferase [Gemmatimonadota bacterium]
MSLAPDLSSLCRALDQVAQSFPPVVQRRGINRNYAQYRTCLRILAPVVSETEDMLDLGSGAGVVALVLRQLGKRVLVLDTWREYDARNDNQMGSREQMLERFRVHTIVSINHDLCSGPLPFGNASFDLVTFYDVIEHLPGSPRSVLEEIFRVLRPGGYLALTTPNVGNLRSRVRLLLGQTPHFPIEIWHESDPYYGHIREYTPREVAYMLERAGFRLLTLHLSNAPQWNNRGRSGEWGRVPLPTSGFQIAKFLYFAITGLVPSLRYGIHALARRPVEEASARASAQGRTACER